MTRASINEIKNKEINGVNKAKSEKFPAVLSLQKREKIQINNNRIKWHTFLYKL